MRPTSALLLGFGLFAPFAAAIAQAGEYPVLIPVDPSVRPGTYTLKTEELGHLAAQVFDDRGRRVLATILPKLVADLKGSLGPLRGEPNVEIRFEPDKARVLLRDALLTEYRYRLDDAPKPYFFPLIGPTGEPVTRAHPMEKIDGEDHDHNHQRSLWFTHGNVNGIDFWGADPLNPPRPNYGKIVERSRESSSGTVLGQLKTTDDWLGPDGQRLCSDERIVRFLDTRDVRVIDFSFTVLASDGDVTFRDTKEGSFGLRVASTMNVNRKLGGKITNAEGITDTAAWGKASPWVDYVGPVAGKTVGIAILNHPSSFRYPTTWHVRDYGLFAANPFGWHDFGKGEKGDYTIPAGQSIRLDYRVILHPGETESAAIPDAFRAYAEPPKLVIVE